MLAELGRAAARRRTPVLVAWALLALLGVTVGGTVYDRTAPVDGLRPGVESSRAEARLQELDPEGATVVGVLRGRDALSLELIDSAQRVLYEVRALPGVVEVVDPYTTGATNLFADDRQGAVVLVELDPDLDTDRALAVAEQVATALRSIDTPEVLVGGELFGERDFAEQAVEDAVRGETAALAVLLVVLIVVLGGVVVGLLPLAGALATVAATLLVLTALAGVVPVDEYAVNVVTLLGLGLAVDYSLLVLSRFREERAQDPRAPLPELMARTTATAGRAVLVSGLAVGIAMAGLFALADPLLSAMALGGAVVVAVATVTALTLVPALIAVSARRIPPPRVRSGRQGRPGRSGGLLATTTAFAQRHAVAAAVVATGVLLLLGAPLLQLQVGDSDVRVLPATSEARQAAEAAEHDVSGLGVRPVVVVVEAEAASPPVQTLLEDLRRVAGEEAVEVREGLAPEVTVVDLEPPGLAADRRAQQLVRDVRSLETDLPVLVGGPAAELVDAKAATLGRLPVAVAVVVLATGVLLLVLTGSVVVPVKALLLNLLTLTATLGVLVAVFQWGWGAGLLGFEPWGALDITTPLLLFMFSFGLSMDYEVFLLARIKEEWDRRTGDDRHANDRAVLAGISATGPVVTVAALAMGIVFLGFALGELVPVKEIGVGMAVALLLDVTLVRGVLLPATMSLLGRWNWWRPFARA